MNPLKEAEQTDSNGVTTRSGRILFVEDETAISEPFSHALEELRAAVQINHDIPARSYSRGRSG